VQQLVEGMLAGRPRGAPQYWRRVIADGVAAAVHALAVAFHRQLLQKIRQVTQAAGVGQHGVIGRSQKMTAPDFEQAHQQGQVFLG